MQDIAQRREASLQHYREQYDSAQPSSSSSSSLSSRPVPSSSRYTDGEDEIDSTIVRHDRDEVDSVQKHLTQVNIAP